MGVEVQRLRDRLDRFSRLHTALAEAVSSRIGPELAAVRRDTGRELAVMRTQLGEVMGALEGDHNPPVDWPGMTAARAQAQWPILAGWVEQVLVPWYRVTRRELPDCWALHPDALVELSWLRSAHVQSYLPSSHPHIAAEWHSRWRRVALDNIHTAIPDDLCRPGEHLVTQEQSAARRRAAPVPGAAGFEPITTPPARLQLALREHWQGFYDQAVGEDLAWRVDRDRR